MDSLRKNVVASLTLILKGLKELRSFRFSFIRKAFSLMGKKEKIAIWSLLAIAVLNLFMSLNFFYRDHTVPVPAVGGVYTEGMLGQPAYINPLLAHSEPDLSLTNLVYSGLYKFDQSGNLVADLADGQPQISQDQKEYTIHLKRNVRWHNDKLFTADDVIYTIQTVKDSDFKSPLRSLWLSTDVEKVDNHTVKFSTQDISGPFVYHLTLPIISKVLWSQVSPSNSLLSKLNLEAVGTGPYDIKEIKKNASGKIDQITFESFSNYYLGKPKVDTIVAKFYDTNEDLLNAFHSKEISGLGFTPLSSQIYLDKQQKDAQVINTPLPQYQVAFFNLNSKVLSDLAIRQALSLDLNRRQLIGEVFNGNAILPTSPLTQAAVVNDYDPAQAAKILDEAGWKTNATTKLRAKKNQQLELNVYTSDSPLNSKTAEKLINQWQQLGIKLNLTVLPSKELMDNVIRPRKFDIVIFAQKFEADPDPFIFWHSSQIKDPGLNLSGLNDSQVDKLITEARSSTQKTVRDSKYAQLDGLIAGKIPELFLTQQVYVYALDKDIKNVHPEILYDPSQRFYWVTDWFIDQRRAWK